MPWAVCQSCGREVHWRNKRGARLADLRCECGGTLKAWRNPTRQRTQADVAARIRTPAEYRADPDLRQAFRAGARGWKAETFFGWWSWDQLTRGKASEYLQREYRAFMDGQEARRRALAEREAAAQAGGGE